MTAIELTGSVDESHHLQLDSLLPIRGPKRVRVIILYPLDDELSETEWLKAATTNPIFDALDDPEENIYSLTDGRPFLDEA